MSPHWSPVGGAAGPSARSITGAVPGGCTRSWDRRCDAESALDTVPEGAIPFSRMPWAALGRSPTQCPRAGYVSVIHTENAGAAGSG